ncbi:MAG TPA: PPK2 family polyphosphate kinase [Bryobacteraceae bacterium]|nr:PPK2 family polyphosphate kinase [Bryobacteraceae bacterium]
MREFQVLNSGLSLAESDPSDTRGFDRAWIGSTLEKNRRRIAELQNILYAEEKRSLLIVLQSMDTGGKDPIIRDVLNRTNPQSCRAVAFKKSAGSESKHDRFWRFHRAMPEKGEIVVFNRSYFDEIFSAYAHGDVSDEQLQAHCRQINAFEYILAEQGIQIIRIFLHISKDEQRKRLQERIDDPTRHWELSESDFTERKYWDGYMRGFETIITCTNSERTPWYLIPADDRDFRDAVASEIIRTTLERMNPQFPPAKVDLSRIEWH